MCRARAHYLVTFPLKWALIVQFVPHLVVILLIWGSMCVTLGNLWGSAQ